MPVHVKEGRDHWYHRLHAGRAAASATPSRWTPRTCSTSSTPPARPGKPKGIVHTTGGYLVGTYATTKLVFDLRDEDVYWCTADIGWVTGHSYVVYGPLANGATVLMYEGAPDWPQKDRFWSLIETLRRHDLLHGADGDSRVHALGHRVSRSPRPVVAASASDRSASRSIRKRGSGTTRPSAANAVRSSIPGGRPRPARS